MNNISKEDSDLNSLDLSETQVVRTFSNVTSNYTTPYDPPVEIVVLLSIFYGAISLVAVLGNK